MENKIEKIGQEQFHHFVFNQKLSWQEVIYDLINTEQLDPWDINLSILANKYLEKIKELEETNFILTSKVIFIASLMLKLKSELLLNLYIKNLDDILFDRKKQITQEKLSLEEFDQDEIPELLPRTPLPRFKKISLQELISALDKAVKTETRREIKKQIEKEQIERTKFFIPKKTISLTDRVKKIHAKIKLLFEKQEQIKFSEISGNKKYEKIDAFVPLLHLDNHNKLWLHQKKHFDEIWIHKNGEKFIKRDEIITNKIEGKFEEQLGKEN